MDIEITQSLLTAARLEAAKFYSNTNIIGLIDAICAEIDGAVEEPEEPSGYDADADARYDAYDAADEKFTMMYEEGAI